MRTFFLILGFPFRLVVAVPLAALYFVVAIFSPPTTEQFKDALLDLFDFVVFADNLS